MNFKAKIYGCRAGIVSFNIATLTKYGYTNKKILQL